MNGDCGDCPNCGSLSPWRCDCLECERCGREYSPATSDAGDPLRYCGAACEDACDDCERGYGPGAACRCER